MRPGVLSILLAGIMSSVTVAQTQFTAPSGYLTKVGRYNPFNMAFDLHGYQQVQVHLTDPGLPKRTAVLTELAYRRSLGPYTDPATGKPNRGFGRTFTQLALKLSYAKARFTKTFSQNWVITPRTVFSGTLKLPSTFSNRLPFAWGDGGRVPFSTAFTYQHKLGELLQDWSFPGPRQTPSKYLGGYPLDGVSSKARINLTWAEAAPGNSMTAANRYVPQHPYDSTGATCRDTASPIQSYHAHAFLRLRVHPYFAYSPVSGQAGLQGLTLNTAPNGKVIGMLSHSGSDQGVRVGARCNRMHVNPNGLIAMLSQVADRSGLVSRWFAQGANVSWNNAWAGQVVHWQAGWEDSKTKAFSLTLATRLVLPRARTEAVPDGWAGVTWRFIHQKKTYTGLAYGHTYNPITRYTAR